MNHSVAIYRGKNSSDSSNESTGSNKYHPSLRSISEQTTTATVAAKRKQSVRIRSVILLTFLLSTVCGSFYLSFGAIFDIVMQQQQIDDNHKRTVPFVPPNSGAKKTELNTVKCNFRSYPSSRLYGLHNITNQPEFLSDAEYIRGQTPIILNPIDRDGSNQQSAAAKVCLDTTSWESLTDKDGKQRLPFTDGHNPSIASLASNPYSSDEQHTRLDPSGIHMIASALQLSTQLKLDSLYLGVSIFGGGQCKFGLTPKQVDEYRFSLYNQPLGGKRAVINVLTPPNGSGKNFQTVAQTTLLLEKDAKYGAGPKRTLKPEKDASGKYARIHQEFDDPRLFFFKGRAWVLYRNGPLFGYKDQLHNPIHFEESNNKTFVAYVRASETIRVCCGRNIALIGEEVIEKDTKKMYASSGLKALTWVDPVTVVDVNLGHLEQELSKNVRKLQENVSAIVYPHATQKHRRLGGSKQSNIHGTNGYMVPLKSTGELLGIAHFHRPENRKESEYALHGHHYTHAFFTIARHGNGDGLNSRPFKLRRLSNEFVFRSNSIALGESVPFNDGDIIQFASGLDVVGSDVNGRAIISYGINDCEGGVFSMSMELIHQMLIEVAPGQEVVDLMSRIQKP